MDKSITKAEENELLVPTLFINDKEKFDSLLLEYVKTAYDFYSNDNFDNNYVEKEE